MTASLSQIFVTGLNSFKCVLLYLIYSCFLKMNHSVLDEKAYMSCHILHFVLCFGRFHGDLSLTSKICFREDDTFSLNSQAAERILYREIFPLAYISTVGLEIFKKYLSLLILLEVGCILSGSHFTKTVVD